MKGKIFDNKQFRVLLVDDDTDDREIFVEAFLQISMDVQVNTVGNGQDAIDFLTKADMLPDVVFLDLNMPKMNGMECLKTIRSNPKYKGICIAIYSTSAIQEEIEQTFVLGANVYIEKPSDFNKLKRILERIISLNDHFTDQSTNNLLMLNFQD